ncbi:Flp family type IVb pilin [Pseudoduganella sp. UC29_106]|uniref:Flp family type IVb pilin n=1 Tax=Pseudoduganella sp. UC29_106 TaxID=3374553 RepID=UPI003757F459
MYIKLINLMRDESGVTAIEYALIAALIAVVIVGTVTNVGSQLSTLYQRVSSKVQQVAA